MRALLLLATPMLASCQPAAGPGGYPVEPVATPASQVAGEPTAPFQMDHDRIRVWVDPTTGCHYLSGQWHGDAPTPRYDREGKQMCEPVA